MLGAKSANIFMHREKKLRFDDMMLPVNKYNDARLELKERREEK